MGDRKDDGFDGQEARRHESRIPRLDSASRRKVLKWVGAGAISAGVAHTGLALYDDTRPDCLIPPCPSDDEQPVVNGSNVGFSWNETFTDTSWVTSAGLDLNFERVTTLDPTGPGSIDEAIENAADRPTVIVFEVGGVIDLEGENLRVRSPRTWIAGETAPSPGITITRGMFRVHEPQCIVSHVSVLPGDETSGASDGISVEADDVVFDHCTAMWGTDEVAAAADSVDRGSFINCIIAEGLYDSIHPDGPHSRGMHFNNSGSGMCVMGCLFAHNNRRHPLSRADVVLVNNYIYNFGGSDGNIMSFNPPVTPDVTAIGLHVDPGPDSSPSLEVFQFSARLYHDDIRTSPASRPITDGSQTILDAPPLRPPGLDLETAVLPAADVRQYVLRVAGSRPADRPGVEADLIDRRLDGRHGIIDSQEEVGGYPRYEPTRRTLDLQDARLFGLLERRRLAVEGERRRPTEAD